MQVKNVHVSCRLIRGNTCTPSPTSVLPPMACQLGRSERALHWVKGHTLQGIATYVRGGGGDGMKHCHVSQTHICTWCHGHR